MTDKKVEYLIKALRDLEIMLSPVTLEFMEKIWKKSISEPDLMIIRVSDWQELRLRIDNLRRAAQRQDAPG